jgi:hypothetical protein
MAEHDEQDRNGAEALEIISVPAEPRNAFIYS